MMQFDLNIHWHLSALSSAFPVLCWPASQMTQLFLWVTPELNISILYPQVEQSVIHVSLAFPKFLFSRNSLSSLHISA